MERYHPTEKTMVIWTRDETTREYTNQDSDGEIQYTDENGKREVHRKLCGGKPPHKIWYR